MFYMIFEFIVFTVICNAVLPCFFVSITAVLGGRNSEFMEYIMYV